MTHITNVNEVTPADAGMEYCEPEKHVFISLQKVENNYRLIVQNDLTGTCKVQDITDRQPRMIGQFVTQIIAGYFALGYRYTFNNYTDIPAGLHPALGYRE